MLPRGVFVFLKPTVPMLDNDFSRKGEQIDYSLCKSFSRGKFCGTLITSQFNYCSLVWMFHSRGTRSRVNKIHERVLRLVYDGNLYLGFGELLTKDKSVSIHQRNLQSLTTEMFQAKNGVSTGLTEDIFQFVSKPYDLRDKSMLFRKRNRTVFYGTESLPS